MPALKRRSNRSLTEEAYRTIKSRILDNDYPPGFHALEQDLANQLGISRTPVREALNRLHAERLVEVTPRHGMRVLPISPEDMECIQQIIECLETKAAALFASRQLSKGEIASLEKAVSDMERALEAEDLDAWADADERFHQTLVRECGNPRMAEMIFTLWDQGHRARMVTLRLRQLPVQSVDEHRALVEAIRRKDAATAERIHHDHLVRTHSEMVVLLRKHRLMLI